MVFHESYGWLPRKTLALIRKHNISPVDFDIALEVNGYEFGDPDIIWSEIDAHFVENSRR